MKNKTRESELPDLEGPEGNQALIADNVRALQPVYFAAMLEEMKAFQVLDRIVELISGTTNGSVDYFSRPRKTVTP